MTIRAMRKPTPRPVRLAAVNGEELYERYGAPILGPWDDQTRDVQRAWDKMAREIEALRNPRTNLSPR